MKIRIVVPLSVANVHGLYLLTRDNDPFAEFVEPCNDPSQFQCRIDDSNQVRSCVQYRRDGPSRVTVKNLRVWMGSRYWACVLLLCLKGGERFTLL